MEVNFCQSCGMPLGESSDMYGSEADGSQSADYCKYCYVNGAFTTGGTVEDMVATNLEYMSEEDMRAMLEAGPDMGEEELREKAKAALMQFLPTLKRWNNKQ